MKKVLATILSLTFVLSFAACAKQGDATESSETTSVTTTVSMTTKATEPSVTDNSSSVDLGENYFKEPGPDDIATDDQSGLTYVKNQLLISCEMGTPDVKAKVQEICDAIGAEIVGYIELTSDFQIEFKRDMSYDDLMKVADELRQQYYFILDITLNTASKVNFDT